MNVLAPVLLALAVPLSAQVTWYVDDDACPGPGSGSESDPFCSIQAAVDAASGGDTVLVLPGTYEDPVTVPYVIDFKGKDVAVRSAEGPDVTVLSNGNPDVRFSGGETRAALLEGFTITAGGPGIQVFGASPTIRGNKIQGNAAQRAAGAGIRVDRGGNPLVVDNLFRWNWAGPVAGAGGGIAVVGASVELVRNRIVGNYIFADYGASFGAGVFAKQAHVRLVGNLIAWNRSTDEALNYGGGLYASDSVVVSVGNTFFGNLAKSWNHLTWSAGGAMCLDRCRTTVHDTVLWADRAVVGPEVALKGGSFAISFSDLEGGLAGIHRAGNVVLVPGPGLLSRDPRLTDELDLSPSSPLIDAGSYDARGATLVDGDDEPRILDGDRDGVQRIDIGWDEHDPTSLTIEGVPTPGGTVTLRTEAPPGWVHVLAYAFGTDVVRQPPFGSRLLEPGSTRLLGAGPVPSSTTMSLPPGPALVGLRVWVQALARDPGGAVGSYSRRVPLVVR